MATQEDAIRAANGTRGSLPLRMSLSDNVFAAGQQLSGVLVFRPAKPVRIHSLTVNITGREEPAGTALARTFRRVSSFFERDVLLSGMSRPRFTSERVSLFWNAFLGREVGRKLSAGEHVYPFSIPLPASLPGTYDGKAGRISYTVTARVQFPSGRTIKVAQDVLVRFVPRAQRARPVALTYPNANGTVHQMEVTVSLELPDRAIELGRTLSGHFTVSNPQHAKISKIIASLETCEWVKSSPHRKIHRTARDSVTIVPEDAEAESMEFDIDLSAPPEAVPTLEGTAISVIWLLKLSLNTSPPLELKAPITVYAPLP